MTRYLPLMVAALLAAWPCWAAGNDRETLCDALISTPGYDCICSEPLTNYDNFTYGAYLHNPGGSTTEQCTDAAIQSPGWWSKTGPPALYWADAAFAGLTVSGNPAVTQVGPESDWYIGAPNVNFTGGTYCYRFYSKHDPVWNCTSNCKWILGLQDCPSEYSQCGNIGSNSTTPGSEIFINRVVQARLGSTHDASVWCQDTNEHGCSTNQRLRWRGDWYDFEDHIDEGWTRWEVCYDHDLSAAAVAAANAAYDSVLDWQDNRLYMRVRATGITGPGAGLVRTWGPGKLARNQINANSGYRNWIFSTLETILPGGSGQRGALWVAYVLAGKRDIATATWWLGPASEVTE